jgi:hypothetical protein
MFGRAGNENYTTGTANLANASLVIHAQAPSGYNLPNGGANLTDTFTVVGDLPAPVAVVVTLTIDSTLTGPDSLQGDTFTVYLANGGGLQTYYNRFINFGNCDGVLPGGQVCDRGYGHIVRPISYIQTVDNANRSFRVDAYMWGGAGHLVLDATAILSLGLPQGLSYTTASGVFPLPAVPEPHTWALMLAGLVFVGVHRRGKTRALGAGSPEH